MVSDRDITFFGNVTHGHKITALGKCNAPSLPYLQQKWRRLSAAGAKLLRSHEAMYI